MTKPLSRLRLIHGRRDPNQEMDDWGFDGPDIDHVEWLHVTYNATFNLGFATEEAARAAQELTGWESWDENCLAIPFIEGLVHVPKLGAYFGDWEIQIGEGVL